MGLRLVSNIEVLEQQIEHRGKGWRVVLTLLRSRFFIGTLAFYMILLLIIGGYQISQYADLKGSFEDAQELLVLPPPMPPPPQQKTQETEVQTKEVKVATAPSVSKDTVRLTVNAPSTFQRAVDAPVVAPSISPASVKIGTALSTRIAQAEITRLQRVRSFQKAWKVQGSGRNTQAEFTIFKCKYQDGDWNCNPNDVHYLLLQIRRWSRDRLKASLHPKTLDVGTDEIFTIKPPFLYLTGHVDFHFLDKEVTNIRDYLMLGGCVWADSALAGRRSRFDMAFRREMKRVLPDRDFEIVPPDHEMFDTYFENIRQPSGMNYYQEPAEMINIGDELAVLYTLNGYGHFWETQLNSAGKIEWNLVPVRDGEGKIVRDSRGRPRWHHVYGPHLGHRFSGILYRNINDTTVNDNYKFGINVVVHLLTRYQDKFRFLPLETETEDAYTRKISGKDKEEAGYKEEQLPEEKEEKGGKTISIKRIKMETPSDKLKGFGTTPTAGKPPDPGAAAKEKEKKEEKK